MDPYLFSKREVNLAIQSQRDMVAGFLARHGLTMDGSLEKYYGIFRDGALIGGIGYTKNVVKCAAVDEEYRGEGILVNLVSRAIAELHRNGVQNVFVFTKPENRVFFGDLGFTKVAETRQVLLLESGRGSFQRYLEALPRPVPGVTGAIVMNANPFTLGHRHLVETAAAECDRVIVFVVEEDASEFSYADRIRLIREGTADLPTVTVVPGGDYIISSATFPTYFLKAASVAAFAHSELDAAIFGEYIAPASGISRRYVGEEPECNLTDMYNSALELILQRSGITVRVIPRKEQNGKPVSASRVRRLLAEEGAGAVRGMVPESTFAFLQSPAVIPTVERIKEKLHATSVHSTTP